MQGETAALGHPLFDGAVLVGAEVVADQVHCPARILAIQVFEEGQEFLVGVALSASGLHVALMDGQRGQQAGGTVSLVRGRLAARLVGPQRQLWLGAVQGLDVGLLVLASNSGSGLLPHQYSILCGLMFA